MASIGEAHDVLVSHLAASGHFDGGVETFEPKEPPTGRFHAAVIFSSIFPAEGMSGLAATTYSYVYTVLIFRDMLSNPMDEIDKGLRDVADALLTDFNGDFTLGGNIREIDLLGEAGTPLSVHSGHITVAQKAYRTIEFTVPLIVNDAATQAA